MQPGLIPLVEAHDPLQAGGKAWALGRLARAGMQVPDGQVLDADAFAQVLAHCGAQDEAAALALPPAGCPDLAARAARLRSLLRACQLPPAVAAQLAAARAWIGAGVVAVRSSAANEDGRTASFAGQYESLLDVDADGLERAVRACWASLYSEGALRYRQRVGLAAGFMAVIVQRMAPARVGGVCFGAHPVSGDVSQIWVEAAAGGAHHVVAGSGRPHQYAVRRDSLAPVRLPASPRAVRLLDTEEVGRVARLNLAAERVFGAPQDVEWVLDAAGTLHLLQSRALVAPLPLPT